MPDLEQVLNVQISGPLTASLESDRHLICGKKAVLVDSEDEDSASKAEDCIEFGRAAEAQAE